MKRLLVATLAVVMLMTVTAPAKSDITGWIGRLQSDDLLIDGTMTWGGAIGFSFAKYFGVEFVVDYVRDSELPFNLEELEELFGIDLSVDMLFLSGNVLLQYPAGSITPFFTIGYGGFGIRISSQIFDDLEEELSGTLAFNWGFGAKLDVAPFIAVRGEWRQYRLDFQSEGISNLLTTIENPQFDRLAVGVAITF